MEFALRNFIDRETFQCLNKRFLSSRARFPIRLLLSEESRRGRHLLRENIVIIEISSLRRCGNSKRNLVAYNFVLNNYFLIFIRETDNGSDIHQKPLTHSLPTSVIESHSRCGARCYE